MNMLKSNKGIVLMITLAFLALFTTATVLYITAITSDFKLTKRSTNSYKAFFLAESGISKTLHKFRKITGYSGGEGLCSELMPMGEYTVDVYDLSNGDKRVVSTGYFPRYSGQHVAKSIEAVMSARMPDGFYGNAIFAGENVDLNGNYAVTGGIRYGDNIDPEEEPALKFEDDFPILNFETLRSVAVLQVKANGQNNLYTAADLNDNKPFPDSFWFDKDAPFPPGPQVPNVVYVETNLVLRGNVGTICGFFVVAGDVITNPSSDDADTTIDGNGTIDGCVYTQGDFRINGGGVDGLEVNGGVWAQGEVELNGKAQVGYKGEYQTAIGPYMKIIYKIISWREKY